MPNKIFRFWQELRRRRVIHVIAVYTSASFVLIELVSNLTEPLNFPANLTTILIIVLAAGFPLTILLSWFYDLTGKGIERTSPIEEVPEGQAERIPNAWKIATYVSFAVIIGLVTFNIVGGSNLLRAGDIPILMILPFDNYTGDDQMDDLISGMHSAFISDIGRISGLQVMSKTTSDAYKDKPVSQIAEEQGVDYIVVPIVQCLADSICFQWKVVSPEGEQRWISDYREPLSQLPNLKNTITREIAEEVHVKLSDETEQILAESRTADPEAIKAYYRGIYSLEGFDFGLAIEYFNRAIDIDPDWAPPYAGLSRLWTNLRFWGAVPDSIARPNIYTNLNIALELEPNTADTYYAIAGTETWTEMNWKKGEEAYIRTLELNPNDAMCRLFYAHLLMILQRQNEAVVQAQVGLKLDPLSPLILSLYGTVMMNEGDYESAIAHFEEALSINPNFSFGIGNLQRTFLLAGEYEKWFPLWKEIVCWDDFIITAFGNVLHQEGLVPAVEELFRLNEEFGTENCHLNDLNKFDWYMAINDYDKALDYLEKIYEAGFTQLHYAATEQFGYEQLKSYPRYVEILRKLNLPVPEEE